MNTPTDKIKKSHKKNHHGNRKCRNARKMNQREALAFWDMTGDAYTEKERDIMLTLCKSSSLETWRHVERKLKELEDENKACR